MGLIAHVYRSADGMDCTLHGWSSRFKTVCVINAEGPFDPDENCPAVLIRRHRTMPALHIVLNQHMLEGRWTMMGGNFLHSSDSRFGEACNAIMTHGNGWPKSADRVRYNIPEHMSFGAIPIHDRIEG